MLGALNTYRVTIPRDWGYRAVLQQYSAESAPDKCTWNEGLWKLDNLTLVEDALKLLTDTRGMRGPDKLITAMRGRLTIVRSSNTSAAYSPPNAQWALGDIVLTDGMFGGSREYQTISVIHEVGHVWDFRRYGILSEGLMRALGTITCTAIGGCGNWDPYANPEVPAGAQLQCSVDDIKRKIPGCEKEPYAFTYGSGSVVEGPGREDWADSFADVIYPAYQQSENRTNLVTDGIRERYVRDQLNNVR